MRPRRAGQRPRGPAARAHPAGRPVRRGALLRGVDAAAIHAAAAAAAAESGEVGGSSAEVAAGERRGVSLGQGRLFGWVGVGAGSQGGHGVLGLVVEARRGTRDTAVPVGAGGGCTARRVDFTFYVCT